jgi:uridine phosphorylase
MMTGKTLYLQVDADDIGEVVLLTGDPARIDRIGEHLQDTRVIAQNREFYTVTGSYKGLRVSGVSSGIGAPSAAIAIEELALLGVKAIVRVGTTMGVSAPMGKFVISTGAVRYEGTSSVYMPLAYPAVPDWQLSSDLIHAARASSYDVLTGITATYDAFYPQMAPSLIGNTQLDVDALEQAGVLALDMETALLYILTMKLKIASTSACIVTNQASPFAILENETRRTGEQALIRAVLDGLHAWSQR